MMLEMKGFNDLEDEKLVRGWGGLGGLVAEHHHLTTSKGRLVPLECCEKLRAKTATVSRQFERFLVLVVSVGFVFVWIPVCDT